LLAGGSDDGFAAVSNAGPFGAFRLDFDPPFLLEVAGASPSDFCSAEPCLALLRATG
jgi:hypothetical protein